MAIDKSQIFLTILQLSDSAFPTGGFSHSLGCEAALQRSFVINKKDIKLLLLSCLENAGSFNIPFVRRAFELYNNVEEIMHLSQLYTACLVNHVAKRASIQQGKSLLWSSLKTFEDETIIMLQSFIDGDKIDGHQAIIFGCLCAILGLPIHQSLEMYLFNALRTATASIVRIGKYMGPVEAQKLQYKIQQCIPDIIQRYAKMEAEDAFIAAPLIDIFQNSHDNLFKRLFCS